MESHCAQQHADQTLTQTEQVTNTEELEGLPVSLKAWTSLTFLDEYWKPWDILRPWFKKNGYSLFYLQHDPLYSHRVGPNGSNDPPPAEDSFGLYGDRKSFMSQFISEHGSVFAARDSKNRDVVIKVISKGNEGLSRELEIMRYLNTEPIRSDPNNATVHVLEFLTYDDWVFSVTPFCDTCDCPPFHDALECLDFAEQVLAALTFLHQHRIAHLDISHENILMNYYGHHPEYENPPLEFRATFPVRYWLIDFGFSHKFPLDSKLFDCRVQPFQMGREHRAPETSGVLPYDPFAADVYQTSRFFYAWFLPVVPEIPGFLEILQDMSSVHPPDRISMSSAYDRVHALRIGILDQKELCEKLARANMIELLYYPRIPRAFLRAILEWSRMFFSLLRQKLYFALHMV